MPSNNDMEREEIEQYKPPLRTMTKFTLVVMWVLLFIAIWWNQSNVPADPWWVIGMPFCGFITFITLYGPAEVKLASPGGISQLHHDSIKTNNPIKVIPAIPGRVELGIYSFGSVDAPHFGIGTFVGTRELIVVPTKLGMKRGRNLDVNCATADFTDHTQLPPDVYEALQGLNEYKPEMHIEYGLLPSDWLNLSDKDRTEFKEMIRFALQKEFPEETISPQIVQGLYMKMEELANTASPFKYDDSLTGAIKNFDAREKTLNHQVIELTAVIKQWESMYAKLMKTSNPRVIQPPPGPIERMTNVASPEQDRGGGQSG